MRTQTMFLGTVALTVLLAGFFPSVHARATAVGDIAPAASGAAPPSYPSGVAEAMKLFKGGIPADIIVSYVHNSPLSFYLSADNIISLQQQGVPSPVVTAMIERYGELQRQTGLAPAGPPRVAAPAPTPAPPPVYYPYAAGTASPKFDAALQARAEAYNYAYVAPPNYGIYSPPAPAYYEPYVYDPFVEPWYPFGGPFVFDFGVGRVGGFGHGGFGHGGFGGRAGGFGGRVGGFGGRR